MGAGRRQIESVALCVWQCHLRNVSTLSNRTLPARPEVTTRSRPHCRRGTGGAKARGSPAHGSILGRLSKNCKKDVSHAYKSKKTPFGTTQQSTRQAPSSSTQTQVEFKLSSSWTQVELQSRRRRKPAEKSAEASGKVGGSQRKSRRKPAEKSVGGDEKVG